MFDALGRFALGQFRKILGATPARRRFAINGEDRSFAVLASVRITINAEDRKYAIIGDDRKLSILADDRRHGINL